MWGSATPFDRSDSRRNGLSCSIRIPLGLVFSFFLILSCGMDGYHDLGEPVNRFSLLGERASGFFRSESTMAGPTAEILLFESIKKPVGQCRSLRVSDEGDRITVLLEMGTYSIASERIGITYTLRYQHVYQPSSSPTSRTGATRREIYRRVEGDWRLDLERGYIGIGDLAYVDLRLLTDRILSRSQANWQDVLTKLFFLSTMAAHARIEGFGGMGMLQYMGKTTPINGLVSGGMELRVEGLSPVTTWFHYDAFVDLPGWTLTGLILIQSDMNGIGQMRGRLGFRAAGFYRTLGGWVDYSGIHVTNSLPDAGFYQITLDDSTAAWSVPFDAANPGRFDLTILALPDSLSR